MSPQCHTLDTYVIAQGMLQMDPAKVSAVSEWFLLALPKSPSAERPQASWWTTSSACMAYHQMLFLSEILSSPHKSALPGEQLPALHLDTIPKPIAQQCGPIRRRKLHSATSLLQNVCQYGPHGVFSPMPFQVCLPFSAHSVISVPCSLRTRMKSMSKPCYCHHTPAPTHTPSKKVWVLS